MTQADWRDVLDEVAALGARAVQFIGGEPTLHRDLPHLLGQALDLGLRVEVFSNLVHVTPLLWDAFAQPGVRLATSYYSDHVDQHEAITNRRGSHARTRANIAEAVRRSIPLRVGIIDVDAGQRLEQARAELADLSVLDVHTDRLRQVGRGVRDQAPDGSQLCGHCAHGVVAVSPTGDVWPCVFARWMSLGNVRRTPLAEIVAGPAMDRAQRELAVGTPAAICDPRCCPNTMCDPLCSPSCSPSCAPAGNCIPAGNCAPNY
jgi:MoaA/NifB/PqqE/SkfB family radical SAM enzyme